MVEIKMNLLVINLIVNIEKNIIRFIKIVNQLETLRLREKPKKPEKRILLRLRLKKLKAGRNQ